MKRRLIFDGASGPRLFQTLYAGILNAKVDARSIATLRKEARILGALEAVSVPSQDNMTRTIPEGARVEVELEQQDFDLALEYVEKAPWRPIGAADAVRLVDFMSASERVDP